MKTIVKYLIIILATAAVCFGCMYMCKSDSFGVEVGSDKKIMVTSQVVTQIRQIGQWEFMAINDEEVVDTVRVNRIFADDQLAIIYQGTLRIGVDLDKCGDDWVQNNNDTLTVTLPAPQLLDERFVDEAGANVFYSSGRWSNADRESMYRRAAARMRQRALTPANMQRVRLAARQRFAEVFMSLGAKQVDVRFADE